MHHSTLTAGCIKPCSVAGICSTTKALAESQPGAVTGLSSGFAQFAWIEAACGRRPLFKAYALTSVAVTSGKAISLAQKGIGR